MPDWKQIKAEYINGHTSYRKLADKYSVSFSTLRKIAAKENWTDLRNNVCAKRDTKLVNALADREAARAVKLFDAADALLQKIAAQISEIDYIDSQEASAYAMALERCKRICDVRSREDIEEQRARIEKLRKEAQTEQTSKDIEVVIDSELDKYSE